MKLQNLEDKVIDLTNILMSNYTILDEYWAYHPSNENFINPIKEYEKMKLQIEALETELEETKAQIERFNALN
jgi:predicted  nucleic acid-binding Zn-ribbon protein